MLFRYTKSNKLAHLPCLRWQKEIPVPRSYFDVDGTFYSSRLTGTVISVYNTSMKKVHIKWDLDDIKTDIKIDDLTIEAQGSPKQTIKPQESSRENDDIAVSI